MKNKVQFIISLFFGFAFLVYLFPFIFVEAAKLESGVTINAPTTTPPPAGTCPDSNNDGIDDATGAPCVPPAGPAAGTCGLQIVSGVPINYGQLTAGQTSAEKRIMIKNEGTSHARIIIKAGDWISDAAPNPTISGPEITHVSGYPTPGILGYEQKRALLGPGITFGEISGGQSIPVYFQIMAKGPIGTLSGSFHQEVSIDLLCGGNEFLKEDETKGDYNTSAKTPNTPSPLPIPYPDTNNTTTGMQIRAD